MTTQTIALGHDNDGWRTVFVNGQDFGAVALTVDADGEISGMASHGATDESFAWWNGPDSDRNMADLNAAIAILFATR